MAIIIGKVRSEGKAPREARVLTNLERRLRYRIGVLRGRANPSFLPTGMINNIIGQIRAHLIPQISSRSKSPNINLRPFENMQLEREYEYFSVTSQMREAIATAQKGKFGAARGLLIDLKEGYITGRDGEWVDSKKLKKPIDAIYQYIKSLENQIGPTLDEVRNALRKNDVQAAANILLGFSRSKDIDVNPALAILQTSADRSTIIERTCNEVEALIKEGDLKGAAQRLTDYYQETGLSEVHGPEPFNFLEASRNAVERHDQKMRGPESTIQNESQWKSVFEALKGMEGEEKRIYNIYDLALATSPNRLSDLAALIHELAITQRNRYRGAGSGWDWDDAQDIHYTISHQQDKNRARAFAVIAERLLENGSLQAFDILVSSIPMLPLVDNQTIMQDDHGNISYYSYNLSGLLGSGGTVKDTVAKRILHITSQSVASCARMAASAKRNDEVKMALDSAAKLSKLAAFLGLFFSRVLRSYKFTDRSIALVQQMAGQLEKVAKDQREAYHLVEIASLLKALAVSFKENRCNAENIPAEEIRILNRLGQLWGGDIHQGAPVQDPKKLLEAIFA